MLEEGLRVVIYDRTSGDEVDTGQDVREGAAQAAEQARARGWVVVGTHLDDGVTGDSDPVERPGFRAAMAVVEQEHAEGIAIREASRFSRQHPAVALLSWEQVRASGVRVLSLSEGHFDGRVDQEDEANVLLRFITFWNSWKERLVTKRRTVMAMTEIKNGRRKTKSGKPPGRPEKVKRDEVHRYYVVACELGVAEAARQLSIERKVHMAKDPATIKKRRVGHSTLIGAFKRYGLAWPPENPVRNPKLSETDSDKGGGSSVVLGPVDDSARRS